jgi:hypothetical protein
VFEIWKPIAGYEGSYEVSNVGRVRSLARIVKITVRKTGTVFDRPVAGKLFRPHVNVARGGYFSVMLSGERHYVHHLVLNAFVGPCPPGQECLHGDGVPANNGEDNLRWGTRIENMIEGIARGERDRQYGWAP